jgi:tRNA(fMet)-specific endonuclease VapC
MKKYFLDTSVIVDFFNQAGEAGKIVENIEGEAVSSWICLAELWEGIQRKKNKDKWEKTIRSFFGNLDEVWGIDMTIAEKFGEIRGDLRRRGELIEDLDIWIAATCVANNLVLVTGNSKHFERIEGLEILHG